MKMTLTLRQTNAIENGMKKYNVDERGLLEIVNQWIKNDKENKFLLHFRECIEIYIDWHK
ncbi:hypothetical protein pW4_127 [Bacillus phage pW4]|uniref:Uncharacterized protein n=1 Tax=Bacillus phage pW4 TaxID=2500560 RepID=A0A3Q9R7Q3_9CAUD|nr:hypothetical protein PP656_gp023 [Bacillus phage pW4]AZU99131.1 hypothetical protein pW4_127 [Bacillus phage pW4]